VAGGPTGAVCEHISVRQVRGVRFVGLQHPLVAADDRVSVGSVRRVCRRVQRGRLSAGRARRPAASGRARRPSRRSKTHALSNLQRRHHQRRTTVLAVVRAVYTCTIVLLLC